MSESDSELKNQGDALAAHIAKALEGVPNAEVRINPIVNTIPQHIASNLLEFLRRVEVKGMEAAAWMEAYTFLQPHGTPPAAPGVQFVGLPKR